VTLAPGAGLPTVPPAAVNGGLGDLGKTVRGIRGMTKIAKRVPGGNLLDAGIGVIDTALNAETQDEKAEGYGGAAGGLAGALAGGAAGAAIGSVVPVIGTVIGGAIGAALGGMGGEFMGGFLGKKWFGEDKPEAVASKAPPAPGDVVREIVQATPPAPSVPEIAKAAAPKAEAPKIDQSFAYSPSMSFTIEGDARDPDRLFGLLESRLRGSWEQWERERSSRQAATQLFDVAHV